jgi:hypothetical protein
MSASLPAGPSPRFRAASELALRRVDWLWPARLALGHLAVLEGDPGLGKSFLALDLCARLSAGRAWPDGAAVAAPAAAIYLNGEDSDEATLGPRLRALGADLSRVFLPQRNEGGEPVLSLPDGVGPLRQAVAATGARLVVIDPVAHFFGPGADTANDRGVRRALEPLADLARSHACVVLLVRHLNKSEGGRALYRGLGSIGLIGSCRSAWLVAEEGAGSGRRVLAQLKNNLAPPQPSLGFEVAPAEEGEPSLRWLGPVAAVAEELVGSPRRRGRDPARRQTAAAFLTELLTAGPVRAREVRERAAREGLAFTTVRRAAREELGARSRTVKEGGRRVSYWLLPGQTLPGDDRPEEEMTPAEREMRALAELHERDLETLYGTRRPPEEDEL